MTEQQTPEDRTLAVAVRTLAARKAARLVVLDLRDKTSFTDFFVVCHGESDRQVRTLAEDVIVKVKQETNRRPAVEGLAVAEWVLLDYGDFLVHIFSSAAREFYRLENLWGDAAHVDPRAFAAPARDRGPTSR